MTEELRHEIVQRRQSGMSMRAIAEELGLSRGAVARVLARVQAQRDGRAARSKPRPRGSLIDPFEPILKELLTKYPHLTVERALPGLRTVIENPVNCRMPPNSLFFGILRQVLWCS